MVTFSYIPATEGTPVGGKFQVGVGAAPQERNILSLESIPDGTLICNIEKNSGDGGKLIKSAGSSALVFAHSADGVTIKFPSGKFLMLNPKCRAMIGVIAGGGRKEKPFLKAGNRHKYMRAHRKLYPTVRGIAQASRFIIRTGVEGINILVIRLQSAELLPQERKVGNIAPRKTGRGRVKERH